MIIIESGSEAVESPMLKAMFRARKQVFVDLLQWDVPVLGGEYEIDGFDNEQADYLIITDPDGAHLGSARLLNTHCPHILGSLFPQLCAGEVPSAADTLEITRFCLDRSQRAVSRRETRNRLVSALVTYALERGVQTYTGVAELSWLQQILAFGWRCRPLGIPQMVGSRMLGAIAIEIDEDTPQLLGRKGIWMPEPLHLAALKQAA